MPKKEMEHKQFEAVITDVDEDRGIVKAIFAVMGNIDEGNDRIHPGSFTKTFSERGNKVLVLDNHRSESTGDVIAKPILFREVSREELPPELLGRVPDATGGAEMVAQFEPNPDKDKASASAFYRIKNKWVKEWSFGYDALDIDYSTEEKDEREVQVRNLRTLKLYEVSPVLWGMNDATMTTDAKGQPSEGKPWRVIPQEGQFCVFQLDEDGKPTEKLKCYDDEGEADAYVRALYANVEDEGKSTPIVLSTKNAQRIEELLNELKDILTGNLVITVEDDEDANNDVEAPPEPEAATEAGPDEEPPTNEDDTLLQLIDIEIEEMEVFNV